MGVSAAVKVEDCGLRSRTFHSFASVVEVDIAAIKECGIAAGDVVRTQSGICGDV